MTTPFGLRFTKEALECLELLKAQKQHAGRLRKVLNALARLQENPRHPGLQSHKYTSLKGAAGETVGTLTLRTTRPRPGGSTGTTVRARPRSLSSPSARIPSRRLRDQRQRREQAAMVTEPTLLTCLWETRRASGRRQCQGGYTNRIEPAKAVMVSATRRWTAADRRSATARKAGCCGLRSWVSVICRSLSSLASADEQESDKPIGTA